MSCRDGIEQREHPDPPVHFRMLGEEHPECLEAADDVLGGIGAVDPQDQPIAADPLEIARLGEHVGAAGQLVELGGVDRDRVRGDKGAAPGVLDRSRVDVDVGAENSLDRSEEVLAPALCVEPDHVVCQQPFVDRAGSLVRQHGPAGRVGPRDVYEVREPGLGVLRADERRRDVQVVVVEPHRPVGVRGELLDHRAGDPLVHTPVALPGLVETRLAGEIPQPVLQEPERRVGELVVETVEVEAGS